MVWRRPYKICFFLYNGDLLCDAERVEVGNAQADARESETEIRRQGPVV